MNRLAIVAVAIGSMLALTACQTTISSVDQAISANLPTACAALDTAHATFTAFAATGDIKESTVNKEAAAYAGVATICADPASVTTATALVKVATAYAAVVNALRAAGN